MVAPSIMERMIVGPPPAWQASTIGAAARAAIPLNGSRGRAAQYA